MLLKRILAVFPLLVATLLVACGGGVGEVKRPVLTESLQAFSRLASYEVTAQGELRQGESRADFKNSFEVVVPDKLRLLSESTSEGKTDRLGLVIIGMKNWSLEAGSWTEGPSQAPDIRAFGAERIWGLVPFGEATLVESGETVNGATADHYRLERSGKLSFELLAGALLAGPEPEFTGDLTQFTIDYWIDALGGWPVRMGLVAEGDDRSAELTVDLIKANDPSSEVEPP